MIKNLFIFLLVLSITSCNHTNKVLIKETEIVDYNFKYIEKPFDIIWKLQKKSITSIPIDVNKKLKIICKKFDKIVLVKIKTLVNNTVIGTFECRI